MDMFEDINDPDNELIDLIDAINPNREYNIKPRIDHFNYWNDVEFFNRFRFSKDTVTFLLNLIDGDLQNRTERLVPTYLVFFNPY